MILNVFFVLNLFTLNIIQVINERILVSLLEIECKWLNITFVFLELSDWTIWENCFS